jgi:hypothetical protein
VEGDLPDGRTSPVHHVGATLAGEHVGLEELGDGRWRVYFAELALGVIEGERFRRESGRVHFERCISCRIDSMSSAT